MKFIAAFFFFKGFSAKQRKKPKKKEIITALKQLPDNYSTLKSWLKAKIEYQDEGKVKKRSFDGAFLCRKDTDELRFQAFGIFGKLLFDLLYQKSEMLLYIPSSAVAYKGAPHQRMSFNDTNIFSILKKTIIGVGEDYDLDQCKFDRDGYILSIENERMSYMLAINRETLWIDKKTIMQDGEIVAEIFYHNYGQFNDILFPARINVFLPLKEVALEFYFDSLALNEELPDKLLSLSLPSNVKKLPLSELPIDFID